MSHNCFISYKSEDDYYRRKIIDKLGKERILGKSLDDWINSDDIDYIMQVIREKYMTGTTVTIFLIGIHSSENEGLDNIGRNKQAYIIRELQATLYDRKGNPRDGLLGIVLPEMVDKIYKGPEKCPHCGKMINIVNIDDDTVIREFSENYYLKPNDCGHYYEDGLYAVLVRYDDFMADPEKYINQAYEKTQEPIANEVHFRDIEHKGM